MMQESVSGMLKSLEVLSLAPLVCSQSVLVKTSSQVHFQSAAE